MRDSWSPVARFHLKWFLLSVWGNRNGRCSILSRWGYWGFWRLVWAVWNVGRKVEAGSARNSRRKLEGRGGRGFLGGNQLGSIEFEVLLHSGIWNLFYFFWNFCGIFEEFYWNLLRKLVRFLFKRLNFGGFILVFYLLCIFWLIKIKVIL